MHYLFKENLANGKHQAHGEHRLSVLKRLGNPKVDDEGRLIGVIKHDEALRAGKLEACEDIQKIVGAGMAMNSVEGEAL